MKPENTLADVLQLAKTFGSTVQIETLSKQLLQNVGKFNQTTIHGFNKQHKHGAMRSTFKCPNNHSQSHPRSGS